MNRKSENHDLVIKSLTHALLQLMDEQAFAEINVTKLCNRANVSRISFYRNYTSLQDILVRHLNKCTENWWSEFIKNSEDYFYRYFWEELLAQYKTNEKLLLLLYKNNVSYILKDHIFSCCGPKPEHDKHTAYLCSIIAGMVYGLVDEWVRRGMNDFPDVIKFHDMLEMAKKIIQK